MGKFKQLKEDAEKYTFQQKSFYSNSEINTLDFDNINIYIIDCVEYAECWNDDNEKQYFVLREYDLINDCFTVYNWYVGSIPNCFLHGSNIHRTIINTYKNK